MKKKAKKKQIKKKLPVKKVAPPKVSLDTKKENSVMGYAETLALCRLAENNPDPENPEAVRILINFENINESEIECLELEGTLQNWKVLDLTPFRS